MMVMRNLSPTFWTKESRLCQKIVINMSILTNLREKSHNEPSSVWNGKGSKEFLSLFLASGRLH